MSHTVDSHPGFVALPAPSRALGAVPAALAAIEALKCSTGRDDEALLGRELYADLSSHRFDVSRLTRLASCRFDHAPWHAEALEATCVGDLFDAAPGNDANAADPGDPALAPVRIALGEESFVGWLRCPQCDHEQPCFQPLPRVDAASLRCRGCGHRIEPVGRALLNTLTASQLPEGALAWPLDRLGLLPGDHLAVARGRHFARFELRAPGRGPVACQDGTRLLLVGCGNIGSHFCSHIAGLPGVDEALLVDPDRYEARNLAGQLITAADIGRGKAEVQAERLRAAAPHLRVDAIAQPLEALPLGLFRNALIVGALDSRRARQELNARAFRMGSRWIDAAVSAEQLLCRVAVYQPGVDAPCLECGWSPVDYEHLEQRLACDAQWPDPSPGSVPTNPTPHPEVHA